MNKKIFSLILALFFLFSFSASTIEAANKSRSTGKKNISKKSNEKSYHKKKNVKSKKKKHKKTVAKKHGKKQRIRKSSSSYSSKDEIDAQKDWIDKQIEKQKNQEDI